MSFSHFLRRSAPKRRVCRSAPGSAPFSFILCSRYVRSSGGLLRATPAVLCSRTLRESTLETSNVSMLDLPRSHCIAILLRELNRLLVAPPVGGDLPLLKRISVLFTESSVAGFHELLEFMTLAAIECPALISEVQHLELATWMDRLPANHPASPYVVFERWCAAPRRPSDLHWCSPNKVFDFSDDDALPCSQLLCSLVFGFLASFVNVPTDYRLQTIFWSGGDAGNIWSIFVSTWLCSLLAVGLESLAIRVFDRALPFFSDTSHKLIQSSLDHSVSSAYDVIFSLYSSIDVPYKRMSASDTSFDDLTFEQIAELEDFSCPFVKAARGLLLSQFLPFSLGAVLQRLWLSVNDPYARHQAVSCPICSGDPCGLPDGIVRLAILFRQSSMYLDSSSSALAARFIIGMWCSLLVQGPVLSVFSQRMWDLHCANMLMRSDIRCTIPEGSFEWERIFITPHDSPPIVYLAARALGIGGTFLGSILNKIDANQLANDTDLSMIILSSLVAKSTAFVNASVSQVMYRVRFIVPAPSIVRAIVMAAIPSLDPSGVRLVLETLYCFVTSAESRSMRQQYCDIALDSLELLSHSSHSSSSWRSASLCLPAQALVPVVESIVLSGAERSSFARLSEICKGFNVSSEDEWFSAVHLVAVSYLNADQLPALVARFGARSSEAVKEFVLRCSPGVYLPESATTETPSPSLAFVSLINLLCQCVGREQQGLAGAHPTLHLLLNQVYSAADFEVSGTPLPAAHTTLEMISFLHDDIGKPLIDVQVAIMLALLSVGLGHTLVHLLRKGRVVFEAVFQLTGMDTLSGDTLSTVYDFSCTQRLAPLLLLIDAPSMRRRLAEAIVVAFVEDSPCQSSGVENDDFCSFAPESRTALAVSFLIHATCEATLDSMIVYILAALRHMECDPCFETLIPLLDVAIVSLIFPILSARKLGRCEKIREVLGVIHLLCSRLNHHTHRYTPTSIFMTTLVKLFAELRLRRPLLSLLVAAVAPARPAVVVLHVIQGQTSDVWWLRGGGSLAVKYSSVLSQNLVYPTKTEYRLVEKASHAVYTTQEQLNSTLTCPIELALRLFRSNTAALRIALKTVRRLLSPSDLDEFTTFLQNASVGGAARTSAPSTFANSAPLVKTTILRDLIKPIDGLTIKQWEQLISSLPLPFHRYPMTQASLVQLACAGEYVALTEELKNVASMDEDTMRSILTSLDSGVIPPKNLWNQLWRLCVPFMGILMQESSKSISVCHLEYQSAEILNPAAVAERIIYLWNRIELSCNIELISHLLSLQGYSERYGIWLWSQLIVSHTMMMSPSSCPAAFESLVLACLPARISALYRVDDAAFEQSTREIVNLCSSSVSCSRATVAFVLDHPFVLEEFCLPRNAMKVFPASLRRKQLTAFVQEIVDVCPKTDGIIPLSMEVLIRPSPLVMYSENSPITLPDGASALSVVVSRCKQLACIEPLAAAIIALRMGAYAVYPYIAEAFFQSDARNDSCNFPQIVLFLAEAIVHGQVQFALKCLATMSHPREAAVCVASRLLLMYLDYNRTSEIADAVLLLWYATREPRSSFLVQSALCISLEAFLSVFTVIAAGRHARSLQPLMQLDGAGFGDQWHTFIGVYSKIFRDELTVRALCSISCMFIDVITRHYVPVRIFARLKQFAHADLAERSFVLLLFELGILNASEQSLELLSAANNACNRSPGSLPTR